jgi:arginyl-tRNA--protein-N-Asp/Glu arginylyltransferase
MFNLYISPDQHGFKGEILDELLAKGYFRLFNKMFTSNTVDVEQVGDSMYIEPIFWLRTVIDKIKTDKKQQHIFKKCASFTTTIKTLKITPAIEKLFLKYRNHVSFDAGDIIDDYKILIKQKRPFESKMILVKEKDKLIALGIFDCGKELNHGIK